MGLQLNVTGDAKIRNLNGFLIAVNGIVDATPVAGGGIAQYDTFNDFPAVGDFDVLYIAKDTTLSYYWDVDSSSYQIQEFLPYDGATKDLDLGEFGTIVGFVKFDTTPTGTPSDAGVLVWNDASGTLGLRMKGGNVVQEVGKQQILSLKEANDNGLTKGSVVYINGSDGTNLEAALAQANSLSASYKGISVVLETVTGANTAFSTTFGLVKGIDTSSLSQGASVWLSPSVAGGLTTTKPSSPNKAVYIGVCVTQDAVNGVLFVDIQNGIQLEELNNVSISSPQAGNTLIYNAVTSLWENGQIDAGGVLQYNSQAGFPVTGETNKLYIAKDIKQCFYWDANTSTYVKIGTFNSNILVSLSGGKTVGRYVNGQTIPSQGLTPEEVFGLISAEPINPTVTLTSSTVVQFNQTAINNVLNFSYTINSVGASVASAVLSYRRQGQTTWNVLSTSTTTPSSFTHSFTDTVPFSGATNAAGNNVLAYQYQYVVTDTAGASSTANFNITPQSYVAPSISFSAPAVALAYPTLETNTKREIGNTNSSLQGSTTRNSALVAISGYQFQVSVNGGAYSNVGGVVSLAAAGGSFTTITDAQSTANTVTSVTYRVLVYDAYNATTLSYANSTYAIIFRNIIFYAPVSASPTNSAAIRALSNFIFTDGANPFILNTGNTLIRFVAAMPAALPVIKTITQVIDLDALNANITSQYILSQFNVQNGGGVNVLYNIYEMTIAAPYSSNHRHQITTT